MRCLFLIVNNSCNINCSYCFYATGYQKRKASRIHRDQALNLAVKISKLNFDKIILTGGDPLHLKWKEETYTLIHELKKRKLSVIINTSAAFLTEADLDTIIKLNIDRVDISIDSHIPEIHNSQRGRYNDAVYAIKGLISRGYRSVVTTTVITERNASTILETVNWLRRIGVADIRIQKVFIPEKGKLFKPEAGMKEGIVFDAFKVASQKLKSSHTGCPKTQ